MWYLLYILCHTACLSLLFASLTIFFFFNHLVGEATLISMLTHWKCSTKDAREKKLGTQCWMVLFQIKFPLHKIQPNSHPMSNLWGHFPEIGALTQNPAFFPGQEPLFKSDAMKYISLVRSKLFLGCPIRSNRVSTLKVDLWRLTVPSRSACAFSLYAIRTI